MKKNLKIISLLSLFVIATTTFFIFAKRPADDKPETVIVKVMYFQIPSEYTAYVDFGNGKIEETVLDKPNSIKRAESNDSKILDIIQKLNKEGYKVISQCVEGGVNQCWVLTLK